MDRESYLTRAVGETQFAIIETCQLAAVPARRCRGGVGEREPTTTTSTPAFSTRMTTVRASERYDDDDDDDAADDGDEAARSRKLLT
jgi:hypothetical protein